RVRARRPPGLALAALLSGFLEPDPLAALPPLPARHRLRPGGLERVRGGEPALQRRAARALPPRRPRVGPRLPPDASAPALPGGRARGHHRLLPPHPLPRL